MVRTLAFVAGLCSIAFMVFNTVIGPMARQVGMPETHVGYMLSAAGLAWMLSSRPWGQAGDRRGQWLMMQRGVSIFAIVFVLLSAATIAGIYQWISALWLFIVLTLLRASLGAAYAVVPVASQSMVAQHYAPQDRPGVMAALGAAGALGMVFGPALGGLLSTITAWLPMAAAGFLTLVAWWICTTAKLGNIALSGNQAKAPLAKLAISDPRIRWPMIVAFSALFSVMSAQVNTAFYLIDRLAIPVSQATAYTGLALTCVGAALMSSQLIVRGLSQQGIKLTPNQMIAIGGGIAALGFGSTTLVTSVLGIAICYFTCGFGMGFVFPAFGAQASISVKAEEVGAAAGTVAAAQAFGMVVGPTVAAWLFSLDPRLPFWMSSATLMTLSVVALTKINRGSLRSA